MKYSPRDLTHQTFPKSVRGYDTGAVHHFLQDLASEWEAFLQEHQTLGMKVRQLEAELNEKRQAEDDIRRAIVAAEKIAFDMRENARKESELILATAEARGKEIHHQHEQRLSETEREHQQRIHELETAFRARYADLQREHHDTTIAHERLHAQRTEALEKQFSDRYIELSTKLGSARQEYAQFLHGYHALMQSFSDLKSRHPMPEENHLPDIGTFKLPDTPAPNSHTPGLETPDLERPLSDRTFASD